MKLPIGIIAKFALKRIVMPAIQNAIASNDNPLTKEAAKRALEQALQDEATRQVLKRTGAQGIHLPF